MGKLTQFYSYLNADKHPTKDEINHFYSHITIDEQSKKIRKKYRAKK